MEDFFTGNSRYWSLAGYDNKDFNLPKKSNESNFIVSTSELALPFEDISEIEFVPYYERIYFMYSNVTDKIYFQYFPRITIDKTYNNTQRRDGIITKVKATGYNKPYSSDYSILKLKSTEKHLFALQKTDNRYYISKLPISEKGFEKIRMEDSKEIVFPNSPTDFLEDDFSIEISDSNNYESDIYICIKKTKTLYIAKFRPSSKQCVFNKMPIINKLTNQLFSPTSFCKTNNGIAIVDDISKSLYILEYKKDKYVIRNTIPLDKEIFDIRFFCINLINTCDSSEKNIVKHIDFQINLILLFNCDNVWYVNCEMKKVEPLLTTKGSTHIRAAENEKKNLTEYRLVRLKDIRTIPNSCILFMEESGYSYALLTAKLREIWMFEDKMPQQDKKYQKYEDS